MPCRHGLGCARGLFNELLPGRGDLAAERAGKLTLRRHEVEANPAPEVMAGELLAEEDAIKVHLALPRWRVCRRQGNIRCHQSSELD